MLPVEPEQTDGGVAVMVGAATPPVTVTVNVHMLLLFEGSVAVQTTVVTPTGKNDPEGGLQTIVIIPVTRGGAPNIPVGRYVQLSVAKGVG
jgi:hypothetical protein